MLINRYSAPRDRAARPEGNQREEAGAPGQRGVAQELGVPSARTGNSNIVDLPQLLKIVKCRFAHQSTERFLFFWLCLLTLLGCFSPLFVLLSIGTLPVVYTLYDLPPYIL